ncbi:DP-EP family protein [Paraglaciecola sp.]|uniref:DP-EP family protein n=1 Tax=Paraglaciecola sp. TaxID=1920173 RepID=UPI003EFA4AA5
MFPKIIRTKTRVNCSGAKPVVEFYDAKQAIWQQEVTLDFTRSGLAIFTLDTDVEQDAYIFFGAVQNTEEGCAPDTNWDFTINGAGNIISFNNDCKNAQNISIKLTLIPQGDNNITDAIISADPKIRNSPM